MCVKFIPWRHANLLLRLPDPGPSVRLCRIGRVLRHIAPGSKSTVAVKGTASSTPVPRRVLVGRSAAFTDLERTQPSRVPQRLSPQRPIIAQSSRSAPPPKNKRRKTNAKKARISPQPCTLLRTKFGGKPARTHRLVATNTSTSTQHLSGHNYC